MDFDAHRHRITDENLNSRECTYGKNKDTLTQFMAATLIAVVAHLCPFMEPPDVLSGKKNPSLNTKKCIATASTGESN